MIMTAVVFIIVALLFFNSGRRRSLVTADITLDKRVHARTQALLDIHNNCDGKYWNVKTLRRRCNKGRLIWCKQKN